MKTLTNDVILAKTAKGKHNNAEDLEFFKKIWKERLNILNELDVNFPNLEKSSKTKYNLEADKLLVKFIHDNPKIKREYEKILRHHTRLLPKIIYQKVNILKFNVEFEDVFQEGMIGLSKAMIRFNPNLGYKFSTYAYEWVFQGVYRYVQQKSNLISVPIAKLQLMCKISILRNSDCKTIKEISEILEISEETVLETMNFQSLVKIKSLDAKISNNINDDDDISYMDIIASEDSSILEEYRINVDDLEKHLRNCLLTQEGFTDTRMVYIMMLRLQGENFGEIGEKLNLSRERVRQIEQKAREKMRRRKTFDDFLT